MLSAALKYNNNEVRIQHSELSVRQLTYGSRLCSQLTICFHMRRKWQVRMITHRKRSVIIRQIGREGK